MCFIGIGSIAKRHIHNLREICHDRKVRISIDAYRRKREAIDGVDEVYTDKRMVPTDYDIIFITNPTEFHLDALRTFHDCAKHFFIEKPVVTLTQTEEAKQFRLKPDSVYYVACPLRYNAVIQWVKKNVHLEDVNSIRAISSSYLPEWRPGQDYRKTYSAHKNLGGGVSIDLIHEWDYLVYLFGWPEKIYSMIGKKSDLEIDSDDYAIYIAEYEDMIAELHLDYFGRKTIRQIEILTKEDTIIGDIANNQIILMKADKVIDFNEERNDYQKRELEHFLDMVFGFCQEKEGFHHGIDVLRITQGER